MTIPRLKAMQNYWRDFPPVHVSVAAYLGIKPSLTHVESSDVPARQLSNADLWRDIHTDPRTLKWKTVQ